jgi:hypothetical protein
MVKDQTVIRQYNIFKILKNSLKTSVVDQDLNMHGSALIDSALLHLFRIRIENADWDTDPEVRKLQKT